MTKQMHRKHLVKPKPVATKNRPTKPPAGATRRIECPTCSGTGVIKVRQETFGGGEMTSTIVERKCMRCQGSGRWYE
jgi:DnaJ-class molecular chaperone